MDASESRVVQEAAVERLLAASVRAAAARLRRLAEEAGEVDEDAERDFVAERAALLNARDSEAV